MTSVTVVGSAVVRLVTGAAVTNPGTMGALVGAGGTIGLDVEGPLTVTVVATAVGCAGVGVCVDMSLLLASVGAATVSRRGVGLLLFPPTKIGVVVVVARSFCATVCDVTLSEVFDTDVATSVPFTE